MNMKEAKIFQPLQIGALTLRNRVGMAPMSMDYEAKDGTVPKRLADIFVRRAEGGTGFVTIDAVTVDRKYPYIGYTTALDSDDLVPQFREFAKRVSDAGSTLVPQIIHPGPESICGFRGIAPLGPSVNTNANCHVSRPVTIDEIHEIVRQYGQAARRAEEAGCGAVSLHCAHAYMLPGAFLSPLRNKRMDEYGGCLDNRARLILEIIAEVRKNVSRGFPIFLRISGDERQAGGNSLEDMLYLAPKFEAAGVNLLEVSGGVQYEGLENILPSHGKPIGMNVHEASEIKKRVSTFAMRRILWNAALWTAFPWAGCCWRTPTYAARLMKIDLMILCPAEAVQEAASPERRNTRSAAAISIPLSEGNMISRSVLPIPRKRR